MYESISQGVIGFQVHLYAWFSNHPGDGISHGAYIWECDKTFGSIVFLVTISCFGSGFRMSSCMPSRFCIHLYPEMERTFFRWLISCSLSSSVEQMMLHRWCKVRITPNLCWRGWLLLNCRYWSVWVGFLYTVNLSFPVVFLVILASSIAILLSTSSSLENWIAGWIEFMWEVKSSTSESQMATIVSSTYLRQMVISYLNEFMACTSNHSINKFATIGLTG